MSIADKLTAIAQNMQAVYDAGRAAGGGEGGYDQGFAEGRQAEYDRFWDTYQQNGERTDYQGAFAREGWTDENFAPKHDLICTNCEGMFRYNGIVDVKGILEKRNIKFDTSACIGVNSLFYTNSTRATALPAVDVSSVTGVINAPFYGQSKVTHLELLNIQEVATFQNVFNFCTALEELVVTGTIGTNFSVYASSKLNTESVQCIIDHLKDLTGQITQTLRFHATVGAKLTDEQKATITAKNWTLVY